MLTLQDFKNQFDPNGHFLAKNGELPVVFSTRGGTRFPGKLIFGDELCVRAEMERGGAWALTNDAPLDGVRFLLHFERDRLCEVVIDHGRVQPLEEAPKHSGSKNQFLANLRIARNLFAHGKVFAEEPSADESETERALARAAIWLTPKTVSGFHAADFPELGTNRQQELQESINLFLEVAREVPPDAPATPNQYKMASSALQKILDLLNPHLSVADEAKNVETALRTVNFPEWVVNWNYELGNDSDGVPAAWVDVFADDQTVPRAQLGRAALELTNGIRMAFLARKIDRWPYIRLRTAIEHKVG